MTVNQLSVVVIGGSLTGLMHGIMLHSLGHNVHIIEQSQSSARSDHAAGITAHLQVVEYFQRYRFPKGTWSVPCPGVQFLDAKARVKWFIKKPLDMTAWNVLYYQLREKFCSIQERNLGEKAKIDPGPTASLSFGRRATNVAYDGSIVTVEFEELPNGEVGSLKADLVIVADGSGSTIRRILLPDTDRKYSGYLAWRGTVTEAAVSDETRQVFGPRLTYFTMRRSYILCYLIPSETGSLEPGQRRLNWVWYCNYSDDSPELTEIMTDCDNHQHRNTLPLGKMRADVWNRQKSHAAEVLNPPFLELINKTTEPFVSTVSDTVADRASFFDNKLLLVGEALALIRPHLALSTNQSAMNCLLLEKALNGEMAISQWERQVLHNAAKSQAMTNAFGTYFQYGGWTFLRHLLRLCWIMIVQALSRLSPSR